MRLYLTLLKLYHDGSHGGDETTVLVSEDKERISEDEKKLLHAQLDGIIYKLNGGYFGKVSNDSQSSVGTGEGSSKAETGDIQR